MRTNHSRNEIDKDIDNQRILIAAKQMEESIASSNILLLRPSDRERLGMGQISIRELTPALTENLPLVLALFQELLPSRDLVTYRLNRRVLLEIADEIIDDCGETPCAIELMHERRSELEAMFSHLDQLANTNSHTHLLIADHDFRSWFANPNRLFADSEPLLFDPIPWSVRFDGNEFLLTRTQAVASEQFTTTH
jgi:hypothetical protein